MEETYRTRLELLEGHLISQLNEAKEVLADINTRGATLNEVVRLKIKINQTLIRYSSSIESYIERSGNPSASVITSCTTKQLEVDDTLAKLETIFQIHKSEQHHKPIPIQNSKLPTLPPPKFSGNVLEYYEFWDKFQSTIDNRGLQDVDKLSYLMAALDGKAKESVSGYCISNSNYKIAVDTLKRQFGNRDAQVDAHYEALKKLPAAQDNESCRQTLNVIEHHLRVLQTLGENTTGNYLRTVITSKFPNQVLYELNMALSEGENTVPKIRETLEKIILAFERARPSVSINAISNQQTPSTTQALLQPEVKSKRFHKTFSRFKGNPKKRKMEEKGPQVSENKKSKKICVFCEGSHYNSECQKYKTIDQRKGKLGGRCFRCLGKGHSYNSCQRNIRCYYCKGNHHQALCPKRARGEKKEYPNESLKTSSYLYSVMSFLQTATVRIQNKTENKTCRLLLDSGSQRSYITTRMAKSLNLVADKEDLLIIYTFGSTQPNETSSPSAKINIITKRGIQRMIRVNIVPQITERVPVPEMKLNLNIDVMADDDSAGEKIDLLIGNDYYMSFMRDRNMKIQDYLFLIDTDFGWVLTGKVDTASEKEDTLSVITYCQCQDPEQHYFTEPDLPLRDNDIKFLWTLESIGITDSAKTTREEEAVKHFTETVKYEDGRYQVKWPWIDYPPDLNTNLGLAYGRLKSLIRRLDQSTLDEYNTILQEQLDAKIIEVIDPQIVKGDQETPPIHYLPHHIVKHEGKKGRIVYDASARVKEQRSLNECMYRGPSMLEDLTKLLIKFRTNKVGITADVEKAFLQVGLQDADRDVTRFLWLKDTKKEISEDNIIHMRFCRVPFGIISSPFLLTATIRHHLSTKDQELLKKIADRCYVDNLVTTASSGSCAYNLYLETRKAFQELSMNIRDWVSNDQEFMRKIPEKYRAKETDSVKVLGLMWNLKDDSLQLKLNDKILDEENTKNTKSKRDVLRILASFYDPCGFASPIVLPAKILLQELWRKKLKWDTSLPKDIKTEWLSIVEALRRAKNIRIPRYIGYEKSIEGNSEHELHCFTDASKMAHAAVVYLRVTNKQKTETVFIMSKSRVNPLTEKEDLKIPRLELLGYVIGSRLLSYVKDALEIPIKKQYLWTDSLIVLSWMKSNKLLPPFVTRRVNEIKQNTEVEMCYINTEQNPADLATRPELWSQKQKIWFKGPPFLSKKKTLWPVNNKMKDHLSTFSVVAEGLDNENPENKNENEATEMQIETSHSMQTNPNEEPLDSQLLELKKLQSEYFKEEMMGKETHLSRNLGLFVDVDGLLRCKGRVTHTDWSYEMKHPILLPKDCDFTSKIIKEIHEKNYHVGVSHTLSIIRQKFWIPQGRSQVQKFVKKCPQCVKHGGGPYELPPTPDLPPERVTFSAPFTYTGMDYFGPMYVNAGQEREKRWVCLYTCLVVRAIHMEVVKNLTAEECLLSLRRFVASRGTPALIVSDNALQFKLTSEVLTNPYCSQNKIKWKFIPQLAPWHGGVYERLVAVVKHCLKRTLEKHLLGDNQLLTVIKEVETVCNTRPLTYVTTEHEHILKPADFLSLGKCLTIDPSNNQTLPESTSMKQNLIEGWKRGQRIISEFKAMFIGQYLVSLRERYRHSHKQPRVKSDRTPCVGDIVQIKSETKNRENWKVGKLSSLIMGPDGECRVAKVMVGDSEFTRSIGHLYPLEADIIDEYRSRETRTEEPERTPNEIHQVGEVEMLDQSHKPVRANAELSDIPPLQRDTEASKQTPKATLETISDTDPREASRGPCFTEEDERFGLKIQSEIPESIDIEHTEDTAQVNELRRVFPDEELPEHESDTEVRVKRAAAIRAKEKIAEWTQLLFTLL